MKLFDAYHPDSSNTWFRQMYVIYLRDSLPKYFYPVENQKAQLGRLCKEFHFSNTDMVFKPCTSAIQPLVKDFREAMCDCADVLAKQADGLEDYSTVAHLVWAEFIEHYRQLNQTSLVVFLDQLSKRLELFKVLFFNQTTIGQSRDDAHIAVKEQYKKAAIEILAVFSKMNFALQTGQQSLASLRNYQDQLFDSVLFISVAGATHSQEIWESKDIVFNTMCKQIIEDARLLQQQAWQFRNMSLPKTDSERDTFLFGVETLYTYAKLVASQFQSLSQYAESNPSLVHCKSIFQRDERLALVSENINSALPLINEALRKLSIEEIYAKSDDTVSNHSRHLV